MLALLVLGVALLSSCREQDYVPAYNVSLGSAPAPLLPSPSMPLDQNVLQGPRVQATELPAFDQDMPTLAEMKRAPKAAGEPSPAEQDEPEAEEATPEEDASLLPDGR